MVLQTPFDTKLFTHLDILARATEWYFLVQSTKGSSQQTALVGWEHPRSGKLVFSPDGAVDSLGNAAAGGLVRDRRGNFHIGFPKKYWGLF